MGRELSCYGTISQVGWGTFTRTLSISFCTSIAKLRNHTGWLIWQKLTVTRLIVFKSKKDKGFDPKAGKSDSGSGEEERSEANGIKIMSVKRVTHTKKRVGGTKNPPNSRVGTYAQRNHCYQVCSLCSPCTAVSVLHSNSCIISWAVKCY